MLLAAAPGWVVVSAYQCGTANPFATGTETISWSSACRDGKLTERDEGTFVNDELHGAAVISYPDKTTIQGHHLAGARHGELVVILLDETYVRSVYVDGRQISQQRLDRRAIKARRA